LRAKQWFLHCSPKGLDRRPFLSSFGDTRAALSWSTCCIRHNSGTEQGTSRKSRFRRIWAASECASVSGAHEYCSQTRRRTTCRLAVRAAVSYSIGNVDCSFVMKGLSARHSRLRSHFPQYSSRLSRSIGVVHGLFLAYCTCSLNCLGSFVSTTSTEPSFGEQWLPCRYRRRHARSLISSDDRGDGDARLPFLGSSGVCSGFSARSVVGLGAKVLALAPVLGV